MVRNKPTIVWDNEAKVAFKQAVAYIKGDSLQSAEKFRLDINAAVKRLIEEPERLHAPDKYKEPNDGSFRAFEMLHYRISYVVSKEQIKIVRFRHTSQAPKKY